MGCIYCNFDGECTLASEDCSTNPQGCDDNGDCMVESDPIPVDNCESYESDSMCHFCGADFNQGEDCTCGDSK